MMPFAFAVLGGTEDGTMLLRLLGRFHPAAVHFPIALLAVAAALESWQILRRRQALAPATPLCLVLGAGSAVIAAIFGWLLDSFDGGGGDVVILHKWIGLAAVVLAVVAMALVGKAAASQRALAVLRMALLIAAGLVGATGFLGGELVFGRNHLFKGLWEVKDPASAVVSIADRTSLRSDAVKPFHSEAKVDFARDIVPVLTDNCLRCHGGEKVKAKLDLKTKAGAMNGGQSGTAILPGQPDRSALYTLLVESDASRRMPPPKAEPLSKGEIQSIRAWIQQGAVWPEDLELTPSR